MNRTREINVTKLVLNRKLLTKKKPPANYYLRIERIQKLSHYLHTLHPRKLVGETIVTRIGSSYPQV